MNVENPVAHAPEVYMPKLPYNERSTRGATPASPASEVTLFTGARHMGVCVAVMLAVRVWDAVWLDEAVPVMVLDELPVEEDDGVPVRLAVFDQLVDAVHVAELEAVPDWLLVPLELGVPVSVEDDVRVTVGVHDREAVAEPVPDALGVGLRVSELEGVPVPEGEGVPVDVPDQLGLADGGA